MSCKYIYICIYNSYIIHNFLFRLRSFEEMDAIIEDEEKFAIFKRWLYRHHGMPSSGLVRAILEEMVHESIRGNLFKDVPKKTKTGGKDGPK